MAHVYSIPVDDLIERAVTCLQPRTDANIVILSTDVAIVGSGYGASVAAMQLAGLIHSSTHRSLGVTVLERGREYSVGEFPNTLGELPGHIRFRRPSDPHPSGNPDALFDLRLGDDTDVLLGNGLGGGSLINAAVAVRPDAVVFDDRWPVQHRNGGLDHAFDELERLLGVNTDTPDTPKYAALSKLADSLGHQAVRAGIAVTQAPPANASAGASRMGPQPGGTGVIQAFCTNCGNCVTGCNVGAKNTLMMNLIPLAAERGAEFVTGANVLTVERLSDDAPYRWRLRLQRTHAIRTPLEDEHFFVHANYVILAAGALGTTEILQRSQQMVNGPKLSGRLGQHFSTNGDGLGFTFGQVAPVNSLGTTDIHGGLGPGPTITGIVRGTIHGDGADHRFSLEDAAIPGSLVKLFGELITTGAMVGRLGNNQLPGWFDHSPEAYDPLAYNPCILPHSQMLLMMTDDGASRALSLAPQPPGQTSTSSTSELMRRQTLVRPLDKPLKEQADAGLTALDLELTGRSLESGLDFGQYVANPLWRLLPRGAASAFGGTLPGGRSLTVHPLGGCIMGSAADKGVVNADCQVFAESGELLNGLFVMDGSVLPTALATNPFLTIAAVAWNASEAMVAGPLARDGWRTGRRPSTVQPRRGLFRAHPGNDTSTASTLIVREQMIGRLIADDPALVERMDSLLPGGGRLFQEDGVILRFVLDPIDVHTQFASSRAAREGVTGRVDMYVHPEAEALVRTTRRYGAPPLSGVAPAATGTARVTLMELDLPSGRAMRLNRAIQALWAYWKRRSIGLRGGSGSWRDKLVGFWRVANMHADYRQFRYEVKLDTPDGVRIKFVGRKKLRWRSGERRVWDALLNLPIESVCVSTPACDEYELAAHLRADVGYLLDEGLIQAAPDDPDMIETVSSTLSLVAWFTRCLLHTCFWEFGSPAYPEIRPITARQRPPPSIGGKPPQIIPLLVDSLGLELLRYPQPRPAEPVLLIHGLAQGSGIFNTPYMNMNMARYFIAKGYDVWLLDYRLSNRLSLPLDGFAIDAIGRDDIPAAVREVYQQSGRQPVKIFAHCVGAIAVQMAILRGGLRIGLANMVESVCFNAIHPWVVPAAANLVRLKVATFARDWISDDLLDPILGPADANNPLRSLMDRIACSVARIGERSDGSREWHGKEDRFDNGICDRMTFLYGRMWRHANLERSVHKHWHELVGPAPAEVYQQLYYLIERERLLDDYADNTYLTTENLLRHWRKIPTFFIHGERSDVFNAQSATRSAIRLNKVFRDVEASHRNAVAAPVRLRRYPDLGHMDPILGRNAHKTVFADIASFFETAHAWHANRSLEVAQFDPYEGAEDSTLAERFQPETGEVVRAAWIAGNQVMIRYWVEQYRYNSSKVISTVHVRSDGTSQILSSPFRPHGLEDRFQWFDTAGVRSQRRRIVQFRLRGNRTAYDRFRPTSIVVVAPEAWSTKRIADAAQASSPGLLSWKGSAEKPEPLELVAPDDDPDSHANAPTPVWYRRLQQRLNGSEGAEHTFRFLVGSCRYPGTPMERENADAVFAGMCTRLDQQDHDLVFFVGDQIYADAYATIFGADGWRQRFHRNYVTAFNSPNLASLLKAIPVHFAVDDHEVVDNYSGGDAVGQSTPARTHRGQQDLTYASISDDQVKFAFGAALRYMSSARESKAVGNAPQPSQESLWYALDHPNEVSFPCFVLDTRREREVRAAYLHHANARYPGMLRTGTGQSGVPAIQQMDALCEWLTAAQRALPDRPKFVFAGQIIAPVTDRFIAHPSLFRQEEGFFGYPETLRVLARHIVEAGIRNVVFVGGDLHFSCAARIELHVPGHPPATVWQIVSSGLYAPMVFANDRPQDYTWLRDGHGWLTPHLLHTQDRVTVQYKAEWLTTARAHFIEVDVGPGSGSVWNVTLRAFDRQARQLMPQAPFDQTEHEMRLRFGELPG